MPQKTRKKPAEIITVEVQAWIEKLQGNAY